MKTVDIYAAQPLRRDDPVHDAMIVIAHPVPDDGDEDSARALFAAEAATLADTLWWSLPGGTLDALLVALLDRQRSVLVVPRRPFPPPTDAEEDAPRPPPRSRRTDPVHDRIGGSSVPS